MGTIHWKMHKIFSKLTKHNLKTLILNNAFSKAILAPHILLRNQEIVSDSDEEEDKILQF